MVWSNTLSRRPGGAWRGSLRPVHYLFAFVFLLRVISLARLTSSPFLSPSGGDMRFYDDWAQRILRGDLTDHLAFFGLPLYPYLLALFYKLFGYTPFIPGLLQTLADTMTAMLIFRISVTVFQERAEGAGFEREPSPFLYRQGGPIIGVMAAVGWAWFVPAQAFSLVVMPTALAVTVFWLVIAWIIKNPERPTLACSLILGALVGLAATGVATILFALPLLLTAIFIKPAKATKDGRPWLSRLGAAALLLFGVGIGTSPCWIHNFFVARDPVLLSAHGGINFWIGNNPASKGYPNFPPGMRAEQAAMLQDSTTLAEAELGRPLRRSDVSAFWSAKAKSYIGAHPGAWLQLLLQKALNFWNAFEYDDLGVITKLRDSGVIWPGLHFGVAAALALPGIVLALRAFPASGWTLAGILAQMVAVLPVFVTERYRLAAVPGLLIFASFGVWRLAESCSARRLPVMALYFVVLIAGTAFVSIPRTDPALWALTAFTSGRQALDSGDFARAEAELQRARAYVPDNPETNFALGNLRLAQEKRAEAKSFYEVTLRLNPKHKGALNNLALVALEENQPAPALEYLRRALEQQPQEAKTFYLLAKAFLASGDFPNAKLAVDRALERDPNRAEYRELIEEIERRAHE
jgi:tetratricopeptide (TPR) repeat protein